MAEGITYKGWRIVAVLWLMLVINMGFTVYGSGAINAEMAKALGFERSTLGGGFAIFQWVSGLPGPLVALLVLRIGARNTLVCGSLILAAGAAILALFVNTSWQFLAGFGVIIGLAAVVGGPLAAQAIVARWFTRHRARAMALMLTAPAIGGFVAPPLFTLVIASGSWRSGWWAVAVGGIFSALLGYMLLREKADGSSASGPLVPPPPSGDDMREVLANRQFWLMILSLAGIFAGFMMFAAHGIVHLRDLGFSATEAGSSFALVFLALFASNLLFAAIGDRIDLRYLLAGACILMALGILLAIDPGRLGGPVLYALILGAGFGLAFSASMVLPSLLFGERAYVQVIGLILALSTTYGALGSLGAGIVFDLTGSYVPAFCTVAGLCVAGAALALRLDRPSIVQPLPDGEE